MDEDELRGRLDEITATKGASISRRTPACLSTPNLERVAKGKENELSEDDQKHLASCDLCRRAAAAVKVILETKQ